MLALRGQNEPKISIPCMPVICRPDSFKRAKVLYNVFPKFNGKITRKSKDEHKPRPQRSEGSWIRM